MPTTLGAVFFFFILLPLIVFCSVLISSSFHCSKIGLEVIAVVGAEEEVVSVTGRIPELLSSKTMEDSKRSK